MIYSLVLITIYDTMDDMNKKMQINGEDGMIMPQDNKITNEHSRTLDKNNLTMDKNPMT